MSRWCLKNIVYLSSAINLDNLTFSPLSGGKSGSIHHHVYSDNIQVSNHSLAKQSFKDWHLKIITKCTARQIMSRDIT